MAKKLPILKKSEYEGLLADKERNGWSGFQSNIKCGLGNTKTFKIEDSNTQITLRCCQHGGTWSVYYYYTYVWDYKVLN
jgi:hypothetical protein